MIQMKYVRANMFDFYIFPKHISHSAFCDRNGIRLDNITSAGFITIDNDNVHFYGEALSVNKNANPKEDMEMFNRYKYI